MKKTSKTSPQTSQKPKPIITVAHLETFRKLYKLTAHKDVKKAGFGLFHEYSTSRNLLFEHDGRPGNSCKSLFEEILETKGMAPLIRVIWNEFELWRKEKVLKMVNELRKQNYQKNSILMFDRLILRGNFSSNMSSRQRTMRT
jgi:hypothetical protein